ncbi:hypothetical protein PCCS19_03570 [Paenibacillus sp. CCS19]|uniref:TetR/AcrR family transcriptional regulator n=1 Tax=Paenibacillus sp. CCS19 TaxID=3158387 RepID=UPI00256DF0EC|nr:TetR/AcrR family transcriptional regulator [Paenibacillus cellulosilyticus]GMK37304.1 hypothetical protein PCCS19_03570 [Paenibacillus cellulosilyticus]
MQVKKSDIITTAIRLFIEQGYHATSIQDILDQSNISRGTFYKHFQTKGELLREALLYSEERMYADRDRLLIGEEETNKELFIRQLEVMMTYRVENNINALIMDAVVSNDNEIHAFLKDIRQQWVSWLYVRLGQIFPEYRDYLADATMLLTETLHNASQINAMIKRPKSMYEICDYCFSLGEEVLSSLKHKHIKLFDNEEFEQTLLSGEQTNFPYNDLALSTGNLKKLIEKSAGSSEHKQFAIDLLQFVQDEAVSDNPRKAVVSNALNTLMNVDELKQSNELVVYMDTLRKLGFEPLG